MICGTPIDLVMDDVYCRLPDLMAPAHAFLKLEALNPAGSIKLKPAIAMIEGLERDGTLRPGGSVIESSSGNLGVALALVCAVRGYRFCCVTDPNASASNVNMIRALGSEVVVIETRDANCGYLQNRIAYIQEQCRRDPTLVWVNQYANRRNRDAHKHRTAPSMLRRFPNLAVVFVGAGTTGTLMGCADYFRHHGAGVRVIAVDIIGSVTFGGAPGPRHLPGMGTSRRPEIVDSDLVDTIEMVAEVEAVAACRAMLRATGWQFGPSTGAVLAAMSRWAGRLDAGSIVAGISPDFGERYIDTVYHDAWADARLPGWRESATHLMSVFATPSPNAIRPSAIAADECFDTAAQ